MCGIVDRSGRVPFAGRDHHAAESKIHGRLRVNTRMNGILIRPHIPAYLTARSSNNGALRPFNR